MEDAQILQLWKSLESRLDRSISLNKHSFEELQRLKASSVLRPLKGTRWFGIIFGLIWLGLLAFLVLHSLTLSKIFFVVSVGIHFIVSAIAIGVYIRHLVLIDQFDNSRTIVEAQQKLVMLSTSNLKILGLLWLQLPVFSTFFMSLQWMRNDPWSFWGIEVPIVLLEAIIGIWLYRNLNYKNHSKRWFKWMVGRGELARINRASGFLKEIEEFKDEGGDF